MSMKQRMAHGALALWLALGALAAWAQPDPPARAGRLAEIQGMVWLFDQEQGQWQAALRNRALAGGDRLATDGDGRAELRIGSTTIRLGARSEVELLRLDDDAMQFQLHAGSAALRVRHDAVAQEVEWRTAEARFRPLRAGHYRFDREDETTFAATWQGELLLDDVVSFPIAAGQRMEFWRERGQRTLSHRWSTLPSDAFAAWVQRDDQQDERLATYRHVSPEMTGADELDRHGRWEAHPEYGSVWIPITVQVDWAPYRYGRWVWTRAWGWCWVDNEPWAFATSHYGRWVHWRGRWVWAPGSYVGRPAFAPALVAWIGGAPVGLSISIGPRPLPGSSWVPLAPWEVYSPWFAATPRYVERIHAPWPKERRPRPPRQTPAGPIMYGNQGVPGGVTSVSRDVLVPRPATTTTTREPRPDIGSGLPPRREPPPKRFEPRPAPPASVSPPATAPVAPAAPPPGRPAAPPGHGVALPGASPPSAPLPDTERGAGRPPRPHRGEPRPEPIMPAPRAAPPAAPAVPAMPQVPAAPHGARPPSAEPPRGAATPPPQPPAAQPPALRPRDPEQGRPHDEPRKREPESRQGLRERKNIE